MLSKLPSGRRIFIDSNIFLYHFLGMIDSCTELLGRIENKDLWGFTSVIVVAEVWHRLMIAEAIEIYNLSPRKVISYLKDHPEHIRELSRSAKAVSSIHKMNIAIWNLTWKTFPLAQIVNQEYGLLTNDSLNLALMRQHRIRNIATNDSDFEKIKDVRIWKPSNSKIS